MISGCSSSSSSSLSLGMLAVRSYSPASPNISSSGSSGCGIGAGAFLIGATALAGSASSRDFDSGSVCLFDSCLMSASGALLSTCSSLTTFFFFFFFLPSPSPDASSFRLPIDLNCQHISLVSHFNPYRSRCRTENPPLSTLRPQALVSALTSSRLMVRPSPLSRYHPSSRPALRPCRLPFHAPIPLYAEPIASNLDL